MNKVSLCTIVLTIIATAVFVHKFDAGDFGDYSGEEAKCDSMYHKLQNELSLIEYNRIVEMTREVAGPRKNKEWIKMLEDIKQKADEFGYDELEAKADSMIKYYKFDNLW